jgi:hypothetical protein
MKIPPAETTRSVKHETADAGTDLDPAAVDT